VKSEEFLIKRKSRLPQVETVIKEVEIDVFENFELQMPNDHHEEQTKPMLS
jgi:hypothetical protein